MSGKKFKRLLLQSSELDEIIEASSKHKDTGLDDKKRRQRGHEIIQQTKAAYHLVSDAPSQEENENEKKLKSQLESILFLDHAFSRRSDTSNKSKKRRIREISKEKSNRKQIKLNDGLQGTMSNSRSSSSYHSKRKHEPTFNKKKDAERKRIQTLADLAKQLKKGKKK
jgi:hypothetical protein